LNLLSNPLSSLEIRVPSVRTESSNLLSTGVGFLACQTLPSSVTLLAKVDGRKELIINSKKKTITTTKTFQSGKFTELLKFYAKHQGQRSHILDSIILFTKLS
jgi:hypothetical protein